MTPARPDAPLIIERTRSLLRVHGRDPVRMIHGLATADIAAVTRRQGAYTAFLNAKGRMVADARVFRRGGDAAPELLVDVAPDAAGPLREHFGRSIPPLFARVDDVSADWAVVGVYGPGAGEVVAAAFGRGEAASDPAARPTAAVADAVADAASPDVPEERVMALGPPAAGAEPGPGGAFAVATFLAGGEGWDVFVPATERDAAVSALEAAGGRPGDPEVLEALRVAAGRPRWGRELTEEVIPLEAGLLERAISQTKGCYTGQEVIVRILHRGHVNRHLRRLEFPEGAPAPGTELFEVGSDRPRGVVTSAVTNPVGALGLGYVRREVEPPAELRAGSPEGPPVLVEELDD